MELGRDIIITLPKSVSWEEYEKELDQVKDGLNVLNFKVKHFPNTKPGNKCYLVWNGYVRGWMEIVNLSEKTFVCQVTRKKWQGKFIERSGEFHHIKPLPMKGFQGFRYMK